MKTEKPTASDRRLDRRTVLGTGVGLAAAGLVAHLDAPTHVAAQDADPGGRATFVLVHGAYAGAWIWKKIIPLLRAAGHDVYATTGTGMGDRVHLADPRNDLDVFIADVVNLLEVEDLTDVTLVGWSFGGMTITGVAELAPERLRQLVYIDGAVPADGQSNYTFWGYSDEELGFEYRSGLEAGWPGFEVIHAGVEEFFRAMTKDPADAEWMLSKVTPQPIASQTQPVTLGNPAAAALPHTMLRSTEAEWFEASFLEALQSDPGWQIVDVADNHFAPVNAPELTAEALLSLV
jgi:pimeloyl-ACP methyl ester carboxylesterase